MSEVAEISVTVAYKHGWRQLWKNFGVLLGITLVLILLGSGSGAIQKYQTGQFSLLGMAYQALILGPISYGAYFAYLKAARGEKPEFADLFAGFGNYWNVVVASFVVQLIIVIGFLFLIVPGVIFVCKFLFVPYLVVDRRMRAFDAMNESWRRTDGYAWTIFFALLLALPIVMAGVLLLGVGVIVSIMWIGIAIGVLYLEISAARTTRVATAAATGGPESDPTEPRGG